MRVFKTRAFARASADLVSDKALREAVSRAKSGLIDAGIGKFLLKLRVARPGEGRSGGFRTIVVYKADQLAVFVHVFAKNAQANLTSMELDALRSLAKLLAGYDEAEIALAVQSGTWIEVCDDEQAQDAPESGPRVDLRGRKRPS